MLQPILMIGLLQWRSVPGEERWMDHGEYRVTLLCIRVMKIGFRPPVNQCARQIFATQTDSFQARDAP